MYSLEKYHSKDTNKTFWCVYEDTVCVYESVRKHDAQVYLDYLNRLV